MQVCERASPVGTNNVHLYPCAAPDRMCMNLTGRANPGAEMPHLSTEIWEHILLFCDNTEDLWSLTACTR